MPSGLNAAETEVAVSEILKIKFKNNNHVIVGTCEIVCSYLNVIVVGDVFVSRGNAGLHCLDPRLPQLLGLGLQHAAPAGL